jgi:endo-1,4-beta-D-glucanase Y
MTMKIFQIEFKRTNYITIEVEAESQEEAKALAWEDIKEDYYMEDGGWEIESIEEDEIATDETRSYGPHGATA